MPKEIVVTKRTSDYHACLKGHPELWGCGKSPRTAIGDLVTTHGDVFDVEIAHNYPNANNAFLKMQGVEIIEGGK